MHFMVQKLILRVKESNNGINEINSFFFLYMILLISTLMNQLDISISYHTILQCAMVLWKLSLEISLLLIILLSLRISILVKIPIQRWISFVPVIILISPQIQFWLSFLRIILLSFLFYVYTLLIKLLLLETKGVQ